MELTITTHASDLFLYPVHSDELDGRPDPDPAIMLATVHLVVPAKATRQRIEKLAVDLVASETLGFSDGGFEQNEPYADRQTLVTSDTKQFVEPGNVYHWDIPFRVPYNTTPYERSPHGRVFQRVSARLSFSGLFGKTLTAQKYVWFIPCPKKVDALHFSRRTASAAEGLGPIFVTARSEHFTVGGYTRFALSLPDPSSELELQRLELTLVQRTVLVSRQDPAHVERCPAERIKFFEAKGEAVRNMFRQGESGEEGDCASCLGAQTNGETEEEEQQGEVSKYRYERSWIARLPKDAACRPSTIPGSDAHIRMSHQLEYRITYNVGGKTMHHAAAWNLILPGCALRMHSLALPSYTPQDLSPVPPRSRDAYDGPNEHECQSQCVCGETLEELLAHEDLADESARGGTWTSREMMRELREAVASMDLESSRLEEGELEEEAQEGARAEMDGSPERGRGSGGSRGTPRSRDAQSRGRSVGLRDRDRERDESRRRDLSKAAQQYVSVEQY